MRAGLQLAAAAALLVAMRGGRTSEIVDWAVAMRRHVGHHFWVELARVVLVGAHHLAAVGAALAMDGALTSFEAFTLVRGYRWSSWFIVGTTSALLPWEIVELARHPHASRIALLLINVAIVVYLASRALGSHRREGLR